MTFWKNIKFRIEQSQLEKDLECDISGCVARLTSDKYTHLQQASMLKSVNERFLEKKNTLKRTARYEIKEINQSLKILK